MLPVVTYFSRIRWNVLFTRKLKKKIRALFVTSHLPCMMFCSILLTRFSFVLFCCVIVVLAAIIFLLPSVMSSFRNVRYRIYHHSLYMLLLSYLPPRRCVFKRLFRTAIERERQSKANEQKFLTQALLNDKV